MTFASDMSAIYVAIKGRVPTDLNNPTGKLQDGYIASYAISGMKLAQDSVNTVTALPFSIVEDMYNQGVYFLSDVSTGYTAFSPDSGDMTVQGTIPLQAAVSTASSSPSHKGGFVHS